MVRSPSSVPLGGPSGRRLVARRDDVLLVLARHGVTNPEVFGSAARGDDQHGSDIDLLVDFPAGLSIIDIVDIQNQIQDLIGVQVDLVSRSGLRERVRTRATRDLIPL